MRKTMNKLPKEQAHETIVSVISERHSYSSMQEFSNVPSHTASDDEDFLFEVEDY
jgi:hypothetical protein